MKIFPNNNNILQITIMLILIITSSCINQKDNNIQPIRIEIAKCDKVTYNPAIETYASIQPWKTIEIVSQVEGTVKEYSSDIGDRVINGEIFCKMENLHFLIARDQAETGLAGAESRFKQAEVRYRDAESEIEARLIQIEKVRLMLKQKQFEIDQLKKNLLQKMEILDLGGISYSEIETIQLNIRSLETEFSITEKELMLNEIGLRDQDIIKYNLAIPENENEKLKLLIHINTFSEQALIQSAELDLKAARKNLESSQLILDELDLKSEIDGVLAARYAQPGEKIQVGTRIAAIINQDYVFAIISVSQSDIKHIFKNQKVNLITADSKRVIDAKITIISPVSDTEAGTISLKALAYNKNCELITGQLIKARILTGKQIEAIALPPSAVIHNKNSSYVYLIKNGKAFKKNVTVLEQQENKILLLADSGLGTEVAADAERIRSDGQEVIRETEKS